MLINMDYNSMKPRLKLEKMLILFSIIPQMKSRKKLIKIFMIWKEFLFCPGPHLLAQEPLQGAAVRSAVGGGCTGREEQPWD